MSDLTFERYDWNAYRVLSGKEVVAMVLRLSNGLWSLNDREERRLSGIDFLKPRYALEAYVAHALRQQPS